MVMAPRYFARVIAADWPRALNEFVGLSDSSLMYTWSRPNRAPSDRAGSRGVNPSPSVIGSSPSRSGINSRYRHMVGSRPVQLSRGPARARVRSYRASMGAPQAHRWWRRRVSRSGAPQGTEHSRLEKYVQLLPK